ncbi:HopW family type III effector protein [Pseudomonas sp. FP1740]|uniref:HopW family type III effector protein n=1 Tax=Pseudomonas sp. FP1740 TaxID=2954078 RepID=UPI00273538F5|nr:HopW family type III effector protein [Pseudomonas sp. FP1740]WLG43210.1 HopW family type III effector protein [Pseudomonas sp. FP1740]
MNPLNTTPRSSVDAVCSGSNPSSANRPSTPRQTRTRAFIQNGDLATAFSRTSAALSKDAGQVLENLQREMASSDPKFPAVAELSKQLADIAMTEMGGRALIGNGRQRALQILLQQCENQLGETPLTHAVHSHLSQANEALKTALFHQSISQFLDDSNGHVRGIPDLLALTQLDPTVLAEPYSSAAPSMFGSFIRLAKYRSVELSDNLRDAPQKMALLLRPHADALKSLERVPAALAALAEYCPDANIKGDLHSLHEISVKVQEQLLASGISEPHVVASSEVDSAPSHVDEPAEQKTSLRRTILNVSNNLLHKFDAYGALAPMDDKALLRLMRRPVPSLMPEQMHAFLNKHVIHLSAEQLDIISHTQLPTSDDNDFEVRHSSSFDEKMRLALASGSLVLSEEQLSDLRSLPRLDSTATGALRPLLERAEPALTDAERQMLRMIVDANASGQIDAWQEHNAQLPDILGKSGLPENVRRELLNISQKMDAELHTLKNGGVLLGRMTASPMMLLALAPLPLAVSFVSGDKAYSSSLVAHFSKNAVFMAGLMMNELTSRRANIEHLLNRYFVTVLTNAIVAQPTFAKNAHLLENVGFGMATAIVSGGVTLGVFNREAIWEAVATAKSKLFKADTGKPGIAEDDRQKVVAHFDQGEHIAQQVKLAVDTFKMDGAITDILNSSLSFLGTKSSELKKAFMVAEAGRVGLKLPHSKRKDDPDFYPKMGLVALTAGIAAALVMLMESLVGKADYAVDGVWCTSEMLKLAVNPDVDMQRTVQTFKEIVGLNLVMTAFLGVNRACKFLDKDAAGYAAGTMSLTAANLILPGMIGEAAGTVAGKGLSFLADKGKAAHEAGKAAVSKVDYYVRSARLAEYANTVQIFRNHPIAPITRGAGVVVNAYLQWQTVNRMQPPENNAGPQVLGVQNDANEMEAPRTSNSNRG